MRLTAIELYDLALRQKVIHALEHVMFFAAALLYWWPLVSPSVAVPRLRRGHQGHRPVGVEVRPEDRQWAVVLQQPRAHAGVAARRISVLGVSELELLTDQFQDVRELPIRRIECQNHKNSLPYNL